MRLTIPLTGKVLVEGSVWGEGKLSGDPTDPIRPLDIDLGNVSWVMIAVDLDNEEMEIEVTPGGVVGEEKTKSLQYAQQLIEGHTKEELYQMSGCPRLKRLS